MTEKKIIQISAGAVIQHVQIDTILEWLGFEEENADSDIIALGDFNTPDKETAYMKQSIVEKEQISSTLYTFDSENTNGEAKVEVEREEYQGNTCLDRTVIQTAHRNLIKPIENILVRSIRQTHVSAKADSFQGSLDHFTTLLGLVDPGCSINNLAEPGVVKVQVFYDGNTEYRKDKSYDHVIMDVFEGLSEDHITMHNKSLNVNALSWRAQRFPPSQGKQ
ncbi:hypothetical protein ACJMK2_002632 [Sinanodonta woodiana]|uniref:Uncharacterized protein n=1 Tax=Sinanodonta woodiana TaxID=1069815 RepID=A0ABD3XZC6_SINWO